MRRLINETQIFYKSATTAFLYFLNIYTGAPVVGTPILGTLVSCDAEVCGAERDSSRTIQGRMHCAVYFALLCFARGATLG